MQRISSNFTLILKILIPTFWISLFTLFTIAVFVSSRDTLPIFHQPVFRWGWVVIYVGMITVMYLTVMQLKRLEMDDTKMLISNFFKTYITGFENINKVHISNYALFKIATIHFNEKTKLGKKASFLLSKPRYMEFLQMYPDHYLIKSGKLAISE